MRRQAALLFAAMSLGIAASSWAAGGSTGGSSSAPATMPIAAKPDLAISSQGPPTLAPQCRSGQPAITFHLSISNIGDGSAPAVADAHAAVWVSDDANPSINGGRALPAIAAHQSIVMDVIVNAPVLATFLNGHHVFTAIVNGQHTFAESSFDNNSIKFTIDVPPTFCQNEALLPMHAIATLSSPSPKPTHPPTPPAKAIQAAGTLTMTGVTFVPSSTAIQAADTLTMTGVTFVPSSTPIQAAGTLIMTGTR